MDRIKTRKQKDRLDRVIGKNIRSEREMRRMSREELAETLDLTVSHMGLIERGERGATAVTLEKLASVYGVKIDELFSDSKDLAGGEGGDESAANRRKIMTLVSRLDKENTDLVIQIIKNVISAQQARVTNSNDKK